MTFEKKDESERIKMNFLNIFIISCGLLFISLLTLILIKAVQRCYQGDTFFSNDNAHFSTSVCKYVDLFALSTKNIPPNAMPGMTILVDLGLQNLDTGIYLLLPDRSLFPVDVPCVGDHFRILRGEYAGNDHIIQSHNFCRPDSVSQLMIISDDNNNNCNQNGNKLKENDRTLLINDATRLIVMRPCSQSQKILIPVEFKNYIQVREFRVVNMDPEHALIFTTNYGSECQYIVAADTSISICFIVTEEKCHFYEL